MGEDNFLITGEQREEMAAEAENNRNPDIVRSTISARVLLAEKERQKNNSAEFMQRLRGRQGGH